MVKDAVKNTVSTIGASVERSIRSEIEAEKQQQAEAQRIERERQRQLAQLKSQIEQLGGDTLTEIKQLAKNLRATYPEASSSFLASPPVDRWKKQLDDASLKLNVRNLAATSRLVKSVRDEINQQLDGYAAHESFEQMIRDTESALKVIERDRTGAANSKIDEINLLLNDARSGHAIGSTDFAEKIRRANLLIQEGSRSIRMENQRIDSRDARRWLIWRTLLIAAAVIGMAMILWLWLLNRRRRPALKRAHQLFDKRVAVVDAELESNAAVQQRSEKLFGNKVSFAASNFDGSTRELGDATFDGLERLGAMSSELNRTVELAGELLHPHGAIAEMMNMFTRSRYDECAFVLNDRT